MAVDRELEDRARRHERPSRADGGRPRVEAQRVVGQQVDVGPDGADRDLRRHLVGAGHDRQPVAQVEEAVPLEDGRVVEPGRERLRLERVDLARHDVGRDLRVGQREVGGHDEAAGGAAAIRPVGEQDVQGAGQAALGRAAARERVDRPVGPEERQVAELVLAVLGPDHDDPPARRIGHRAPRQVGHVRVQVAPLGGQQIDDVDVLGGRLQEGRRRGEEVDVRVGGDPSPGVQVDRPVERELDVAGRGVHLEPRSGRGPVEPADDLDIDPARRQLDGEPAGHVGIRRRPEDEVAAGVLEERRVDLVAMADRRQVAPVGGREADPARDGLAGRPVHDLDLDRDARRRQHLDRARSRRDRGAARRPAARSPARPSRRG